MQRLNKILRHLNACNNSAARRMYAVFICGPHMDNPIGDYGERFVDY